MKSLDRFDRLLQRHHAGELGPDETLELRELLKSDAQLLDCYLDLCQVDEELAALHGPSMIPAADDIRDSQAIAEERPEAAQSRGLWSVVTVAAAMLLIVGVIAQSAWKPSGTGIVMADPEEQIDSDGATRRSPNPWKVINSTGAMSHPTLTEASIPNVASAATRRIQFNRDIRPILSETCFHCHGPDDHGRRADLRLDILAGATEDRGDYQAIVPGNLGDSEAWNRITSDDPDLLMPPPESHLALSEDQKTLLRRWIEQGAGYESHWAFIPPKAPDVPEVDFAIGDVTWGRNAIDAFVAARLAESEMAPSPEADPRTLIRRLTFDLTGLPPTIDEVRSFVGECQTDKEEAIQQAITRLLDSPHFGERMAVPWLDQARYADTNGYSIDGGRDMWLWRDWVIQAYNDNMPFDQFLTEQLAGDLLPDASPGQRIASGFNRNHMITHEGGTIPAENLTNYVADRVKTTGEVFLALTMGCAQCHDHKYDPISQKEYYQFFAFFNELEDRGLDGNSGVNSAPRIMAPTVLRSDEVKTIQADIKAVQEELQTTTDGFDDWLASERQRELNRGQGFKFVDATLLDASSPNRPGPFEFSEDGSVRVSEPSRGLNGFSHSIQLAQDSVDLVTGIRLEFIPQEAGQNEDGEKAEDASTGQEESKPKPLVLTPFDDGVPKVTAVLVSATTQAADQVDYNSQRVLSEATASSTAEGHPAASVLDERNLQWWQPVGGDGPQHLTLTFERPVDPANTPFLSVLVFFGTNQSMPFHWRVRPFAGNDTESKWDEEIAAAITREPSEWQAETRQDVVSVFRSSAVGLDGLRTRLKNLQERRDVLTAEHSTMVMNTAAKPRKTFVLERGQYDAPLDQVIPQTPGVLPPLPIVSQNASGVDDTKDDDGEATSTRLDLARWMTDPNHPLTARVAVNRIWAMFFGTGIVATSADFGSQGEYPSHPELLDYLATKLVRDGWDQKQLIREIVSSATYRQQSKATEEQRALDPGNRLLGRGPRFRLPAEFIRDQALQLSGLLVPRIGGPSVHPYQPPGLWKEVSHFGSTPATKQVFVQDHGEKLYRRSLYTIVKRTSPHPAMAAFDAPNREMCVVDRGVTNTPLQALVTLNDPQFAEASRALAARWLREQPLADEERIVLAFETVLSRPPSDAEVVAVIDFLKSERFRYQQSKDEASQVVSVGEAPLATGVEPIEHAAWTHVATLLLNLSEALTRS